MKKVIAYKSLCGQLSENKELIKYLDKKFIEEQAFIEIVKKHNGELIKKGGKYYNTHFSNWDCKKSPIGKCVYNPITDSMFDNCVYCHQPDERK